MCTTTSLNINILNINNSDCVSRNDTSLIEIKSVLLFSSFFIFKVFCNWMSFKNNSVGFILYFHFLFFSDWLIMSDINMSIVFSLFSTVLPNMWTENSTSSSINNMSSSVETYQSISSFLINTTNNLLANYLFWI